MYSDIFPYEVCEYYLPYYFDQNSVVVAVGVHFSAFVTTVGISSSIRNKNSFASILFSFSTLVFSDRRRRAISSD